MTDKPTLERRAMITSVVGALIMAGLGIGFSLITGSNAILLDGLFSLIAFAAGLVALRVSRLVKQPDDEHYHFGYGSFEPLFNLAKGIVIAFIGVFALTDAINVILAGGRAIQAGYALIYAVLVGVACFIVALYLKAMAKKTQSPLVEVDAKNWIIDGLLTIAVLIAFFVALQLKSSETYAWMADYADPFIVAVLVVFTMPIPYIIIRENVKQLLLSAPDKNMQQKIGELLTPGLARIEKQNYLVRMTKVGRYLYIHIHLLVSPQSVEYSIAAQDELRKRFADSLQPEFPNATVELIFTQDIKWFGNVKLPE